MSYGAIVLAAGSSERMGSPKCLLTFRGRSFLETILDRLAGVSEIEAVVVVLGAHANAIRDAVPFGDALAVVHRGYKLGMFSSVRAGARALWRRLPALEGALVCLVDQPMLRRETYAMVARAYRPEQDDAVIAAHGGAPGHPVLLGRVLVQRLADVSAADPAEQTLSEFLDAHAERQRLIETDDPAVLQNINTPDAYRTLTAREEGSG